MRGIWPPSEQHKFQSDNCKCESGWGATETSQPFRCSQAMAGWETLVCPATPSQAHMGNLCKDLPGCEAWVVKNGN